VVIKEGILFFLSLFRTLMPHSGFCIYGINPYLPDFPKAQLTWAEPKICSPREANVPKGEKKGM
jgi:hypothetical protein